MILSTFCKVYKLFAKKGKIIIGGKDFLKQLKPLINAKKKGKVLKLKI